MPTKNFSSSYATSRAPVKDNGNNHAAEAQETVLDSELETGVREDDDTGFDGSHLHAPCKYLG